MPLSPATLVRRSLTHYWRTSSAVVAGVLIAVAVLGGALLTGSSVRASLRRIALERLGNTHTILTASTLFREQLAVSIRGSAPLLSFEGLLTHPTSRRRAGQILVYGVDDRFWQFHNLPAPPMGDRSAYLSPALAAELTPAKSDTLLLRLEKPGDIPAESIHGRKDEAAAIRLRYEGPLAADHLGEFALRPSQGAIRAVFVPLRRLQADLDAAGRVNLLLTAEGIDAAAELRRHFALADLGIRTKPAGDALHLDTLSGVLSPALAAAATHIARDAGFTVTPVLTYLANAIRANGRTVPYSLVAALPLHQITPAAAPAATLSPIVLNDWAARDLNAKPGDTISLDYYVWKDDGRLITESADFTLAAIVPINGLAADRALAPEYPGITDADTIGDWDPPFPMNLSLVRPRDEDFWDRYRTTAKAFLPIESGQRLWSTRWGNTSALRLSGGDVSHDEFLTRLRNSLDPTRYGITVTPIREQSLSASRGATDFGEYFLYFSFFLVVSALLLAGLFFRLGVEQRARELGLLEAVGLTRLWAARPFFLEGLILAAAGSALGLAAGLGYAALILHGLNTWWSGAVGTNNLRLAVEPAPLAAALAFGLLMGATVTALTLRRLLRETPRSLLLGGWELPAAARRSRASLYAIVFFLLSLTLAAAGTRAAIPAVAAFFGSGFCLLIAALTFLRARLTPGASSSIASPRASLWTLAFRNLSIRPGRTLLVASLIASATFLVISVESFRREGASSTARSSGTGGYGLIAESVRPIYYNLNDTAGRESLNLIDLNEANFASFRLKPGDDASCLNLYEPRNPRILGAPSDFLSQGRFAFGASLALTPEDKANPWRLLERQALDAAIIPAAADANSLQYVLHKKVGDILEVPGTRGEPVRLQIVAALADSLFQGELLISEANFRRAFPDVQGYRVFLIDTPAARAAATSATLEDALSDSGFDAQGAGEKLAAFHRVENTYLATFQALGALGLLLGTLGLATVLMRNILERRREFALLSAVGFSPARLRSLVWRESLLMLAAGQFSGILAAALAIAPVAAERGFTGSLVSMSAMMAAIFLTGALACRLAAAYVARLPLTEALRAE